MCGFELGCEAILLGNSGRCGVGVGLGCGRIGWQQ